MVKVIEISKQKHLENMTALKIMTLFVYDGTVYVMNHGRKEGQNFIERYNLCNQYNKYKHMLDEANKVLKDLKDGCYSREKNKKDVWYRTDIVDMERTMIKYNKGVK